MFKLSRLEINRAKIQKELDIAQEAYEKRPNRWAGNEALGRVLYLVDDASAKNYLKKAIEYRDPSLKGDGLPGSELIAIGNYYRMVGDLDSAQKFFQKAYEDHKGKAGNIEHPESIHSVELQNLVKVCFFMNRYDEVIQYGKVFGQDNPKPTLLANSLTALAEARLSGDRETIEMWIDDVEKRIQSIAGEGNFSITGSVDGIDLYEIVLNMLMGMEE